MYRYIYIYIYICMTNDTCMTVEVTTTNTLIQVGRLDKGENPRVLLACTCNWDLTQRGAHKKGGTCRTPRTRLVIL